MHITTTDTDTAATAGWARHDHYAQQTAALRDEAQQRIRTRIAQGFSPAEAVSYAGPLLRAARRGRALQATCLLELAHQHSH